MNDLRQAAQAVIDRWDSPLWKNGSTADAIADLRTALEQQAEPVQEPFGYLWPTGRHPEFRFTQQKRDGADGMPLYTAPPQQQAEPVATHRITAWGHCGVCRHDRIPGEGCARQECPDSPQQQAEPVAVVDEVIHAAWAAGFVEGEKAALEQQAEPVGWLDGNDKLADFMHRDLKAEHDKRGSATPKDFTIPVYTAPLQQQAEPVGEVIDERGEVDYISYVPPVGTALYTTPPQRKELSESEILNMMPSTIPAEYDGELMEFARAVEAKTKERT